MYDKKLMAAINIHRALFPAAVGYVPELCDFDFSCNITKIDFIFF